MENLGKKLKESNHFKIAKAFGKFIFPFWVGARAITLLNGCSSLEINEQKSSKLDGSYDTNNFYDYSIQAQINFAGIEKLNDSTAYWSFTPQDTTLNYLDSMKGGQK